MAHVYVSNADSGDITVLRMDAAGVLSLQGLQPLGGNVMPMALHPNGKMLYVARRTEPMALISLAVDPVSGDLHPRAEASLPASMAYVSTDRSGRFLFAASYPQHKLTVSPIAEDGTVGAVVQVVDTGPNAHAVAPTPSNRHVLATSLGGGTLLVFDFDSASGLLSPAGHWQARSGVGPRHFRFDPRGRFVYLLNELDGSLDVLAWDEAHARLSHVQTVDTLPPGFAGKPWAADLQLTPDGRHLYSSERTSSTLAHFAVDAATGRLTAAGHTRVEAQPRGFAIDPSGRHLLVAGQLSHHLSRLLIDPHTASLTLAQRIAVGQGPNWVEILP